MSIQENVKQKMAQVIEHLKVELKAVRTGRANPGMLDHVTVRLYESEMRLKDVASITTPEPRLLLITPFDRSNTSSIGKSLEKANLGFTPIVDGNAIRIVIPPMDEKTRKEMAKECWKRCEEAKVSIRNVRKEGNNTARKQKDGGEIAEDEMKSVEKKIQDLTDQFCKEAEDVTSKKEKEVLTI